MNRQQAQPARTVSKRALLAAALFACGAMTAAAYAQEAVEEVAAPVVENINDSAPESKPEVMAVSAPAKPMPTEALEDRLHLGDARSLVADGLAADGRLVLMMNKSGVIKTKTPYKTVSVANPDIADVNRVDDFEILVTAKKPGNTQLVLWDVAGASQNVDVTVSDIEALQKQLDKMFPDMGLKATDLNGTIALHGRVKNLAMAKQVEDVAKPYGKNVLNLLEIGGGQQVMLQVRFAEVSRTATNQLGFSANFNDGTAKFGTINGPGGSPIGAVAGGEDFVLNPAINVFGGGQIGGTAFEYFIQALRRNSLLRVLAEPNVIAISGEPASFLAGGEFPVPVPQNNGGGTIITIEYKPFGVKLNFLPIVLGDGRIRLKVDPEVSDLDYTRSVSFDGYVIPTITKRTLSTTIELNEGQSFAVAGLLNNRIVASKDVTPLLGDLPIIGTLFRSTRYERSETELVVIVTPRLVSPLNPGEIGSLPGEKWNDPTELQLLLDKNIGTIGASDKGTTGKSGAVATAKKDANTNQPAEDAAPARFRGQYGFVQAGR